MNKLMAMLCAFGAIGAFGMAHIDHFRTKPFAGRAGPWGNVVTVVPTLGERAFYTAFGIVSMAGCIYFLIMSRRDRQ